MTGGVTASRCDSPWAGLVPQDYLEVAAGIKQAAMKMRRCWDDDAIGYNRCDLIITCATQLCGSWWLSDCGTAPEPRAGNTSSTRGSASGTRGESR